MSLGWNGRCQSGWSGSLVVSGGVCGGQLDPQQLALTRRI